MNGFIIHKGIQALKAKTYLTRPNYGKNKAGQVLSGAKNIFWPNHMPRKSKDPSMMKHLRLRIRFHMKKEVENQIWEDHTNQPTQPIKALKAQFRKIFIDYHALIEPDVASIQ